MGVKIPPQFLGKETETERACFYDLSRFDPVAVVSLPRSHLRIGISPGSEPKRDP